jgi:hypothetical protein
MERCHPRPRFTLLDTVRRLGIFCFLCTASAGWAKTPLPPGESPLRNLLISVKNNNEGSTSRQQQSISGGIKRDKVYIGTGGPIQPTQDGVTLRHDGLTYNTVNTQRTFTSLSEQKIRAVEGYYTVEADALQGFYVTARLAGDRVILTISTSDDEFDESQDDLVIHTQRLSTTVSGRIGEWIELSGITLGDTESDSSQVKKTTARSASIGNIAVRITALD